MSNWKTKLKPRVIVFAGPNGAGKSTHAERRIGVRLQLVWSVQRSANQQETQMNSGLISIQTARYQPDYKLHIHFNDGADRMVDFKPFLTQSQHPGIRAFLLPEKFQGFRVEHGDLVWGDYDLCFPVADLYRGQI